MKKSIVREALPKPNILQLSQYDITQKIMESLVNACHRSVLYSIIDISKDANEIAKKTMQVLNGAGVFGIEMFVDQDNKILINEIAPRVHNSGHHTLQSCKTSQFEQHLRAILGLNLGNTELVHKTVMCNILGPDGFEGKYKPVELEKDGAYLKMYGKEISKPQRKLGHFNVVDIDDSKDVSELLQMANEIKNIVIVSPA